MSNAEEQRAQGPFRPFAIHRYRPAYGPFRNLCALADEEGEAILQELRKEPGHGWLVPTYLQERREVERWLRDGHRANGGLVRDEHPIYLSLWPELPPLGPYDIVLDLSVFAPGTLSFTYPDSMISFGLAFRMRAGEEHERRPCHGRVFDADGLAAVVADYGWPQGRTDRGRSSNYDRSVEAQVWDRAPLARPGVPPGRGHRDEAARR